MSYLQRRSIGICILLSIVTCGIYMYYWVYKLAEDVNYIRNDPNATSPGMVLLLTILTCGIYFIYWLYKAGETVDTIRVQQGMAPSSKAIMYLLLSIFGLSIVAMALLQGDLNEMADGMNGGQGYGGAGYGGQDPYAQQPQYPPYGGAGNGPIQGTGYGGTAGQDRNETLYNGQVYGGYAQTQPAQQFPQQPYQDPNAGVNYGQYQQPSPFDPQAQPQSGSMMNDLNNGQN